MGILCASQKTASMNTPRPKKNKVSEKKVIYSYSLMSRWKRDFTCKVGREARSCRTL